MYLKSATPQCKIIVTPQDITWVLADKQMNAWTDEHLELVPELKRVFKYQPSGEGGTRSLPAPPHRLQNPKWPPGEPKMADGVLKGVYP